MHDGQADDGAVLIARAARGFGGMTARRLHARGANLALVGRIEKALSLIEDSADPPALGSEADEVLAGRV